MREDTTKCLYDQFPHHCDVVQRLMRDDSKFQEIVQDYGDVLDALAQWQTSDTAEAESRIEEYRELRDDLRAEIKQLLVDAVRSPSL